MHDAIEIFYMCLAWILFWGGMRPAVLVLPDGTFQPLGEKDNKADIFFWVGTAFFVLDLLFIMFEEWIFEWVEEYLVDWRVWVIEVACGGQCGAPVGLWPF